MTQAAEATRSDISGFDEALRQGVHVGLACWQVLMAICVVTTSTSAQHLALAAAHVIADAGLRWQPRSGDSFTLRGEGFDGESFAISELTIEVHTYPSGQVLGFNGTTEWALDSVAVEDTLWLPREDQLRELLGQTFVALTRDDASYVVHVVDAVTGEDDAHAAASPVDAYALALLALLEQSAG